MRTNLVRQNPRSTGGGQSARLPEERARVNFSPRRPTDEFIPKGKSLPTQN